MFKTFLFGVFLGLGLAAAAAWFLPAAQLTREASIIAVQPNGGNAESFRIHLPDDRIIAGSRTASARVPATLDWPDTGVPVDVELFKIRNERDVVVGVASRMSSSDPATSGVVEWALHLPARGTQYFPMMAAPETGGRTGTLRAGTGEFLARSGRLRSSFAADPGDSGSGLIELESSLVSTVAAYDGDGGAP